MTIQLAAPALALADLDADGTVEIIGANVVTDHVGRMEWKAPVDTGIWPAPTAADLDGDGFLEVVFGNAAYRHDGRIYYVNDEAREGWPAVADFDGDGEPEVLITGRWSISMLESDGSTTYANREPAGERLAWVSPAAIDDFDGDGQPDFAASSESTYSIYSASAQPTWQANVDDPSGISAGTAFDFLGDGTPEAIYADETSMFVFDDHGNTHLEVDRLSRTWIEYPVVADVDNDGSAEILVTSNFPSSDTTSPTITVIRDVDDRWIQARRIWNQHTYHVTNVRGDGAIPQHEVPSWLGLNTFRTNAQLARGRVCEPPVVE